MNNLEEKLRQLKIEDYIWVIYIGIIFLSWYSNSLERKYFVYNDMYSKEQYRKVMIFIFSVLVIIYFYFLYDSSKSINNGETENDKNLNNLSFIASLLIFISGLILLYIAYNDKDLATEIAFN